MELQTNAIAQFMRGFEPKTRTEPARRGRPRKRNEELFSRVIRGHRATSEWFAREHGREARSDLELFTAFREYVQEVYADDVRASRVLSLGYTLKTVQNLLGQARRFYREHPEKCPFLGVEGSTETQCNHQHESEKS